MSKQTNKFRQKVLSAMITLNLWMDKNLYRRLYALAAFTILVGSTVFWSILSARVQLGNADQLVNSFLFENGATFHGAMLPGQHTFLFKWPFLLLIKVLGSTPAAFTTVTVILTLLTVILFAALLYKIDKRPLVFGTICLALASVLLLVPALPYPGGLLPVNMAMATTRNLEYILFMYGLYLLAHTNKVRSRYFILAVLAWSLLFASDKLFLTLALGGSIIIMCLCALARRWMLVGYAVLNTLAAVMAGVIATAGLWALNATRTTHIVSESTISPYGIITSAKHLTLGSVYSLLALLSNFGANPAHDTRLLRQVPSQVGHTLLSPVGLSYALNGIILLIGIGIVLWFLFVVIFSPRHHHVHVEPTTKLSLMLIAASVTSIIIFIASDHYYPVDARYMGMTLFAVFVAIAAYARKRKFSNQYVFLAGLVLCLGILFAVPERLKMYNREQSALSVVTTRNLQITQAIGQHHVDVLIGDYWRVIPTKLAAGSDMRVMPLGACGVSRNTLTSASWAPDSEHASFAYVATVDDSSLTGYKGCSFEQIISQYGAPNTSLVIAGTLEHPKEMLLFYDHGSHENAPQSLPPLQLPSTIAPTPLVDMSPVSCAGPTVMQIVAHEDDDLLFMNPALIHDIKAGHCVRTIYMTAGDSGAGQYYWIAREQGAEAAYAKMTGDKGIWVERVIKLEGGQYVTIASPRGNHRVSLIFMQLPDGNLQGQGFGKHGESLEKLERGTIVQLNSMNHESTYTTPQIITALIELMHFYSPTLIRTQADIPTHNFPDHSDHRVVGRLAQEAYNQYETKRFENTVTVPLTMYLGYSVRNLPENVIGDDLNDKISAFLEYARLDASVCSRSNCQLSPTYNSYLHRQYEISDASGIDGM